jgi:DNA-binding beta-propeller fold protein YncE
VRGDNETKEETVFDRRECLRVLALGLPAFRWMDALAAMRFPTVILDDVRFAFRTPGPQPNGLQATRDGLWILDQGTNKVALVSYEDGRVLREFQTECDRGSGITFDGTALWLASTYNRLLLKVDAQTGKTLKQLPSPGSGVAKWGARGDNPTPTGAHGLEYLNGELWVAVPPAVKISVVTPDKGDVLRSFVAPGVRPHGIGWDPDGSLWCAESNYRAFFKMSPKTGTILKQVLLPPAQPEKDGAVLVPHGMTVWDKHIWFCVAETGEAYRFPLPT